MALVNQSKPTTSISNATKVSPSVTNSGKGVIGFLWSVSRFPWTEATPWVSDGGISNASKPI